MNKLKMLLKAQMPLVMVMVAVIGAMLGAGCEKQEPETPPQATTPSTSRLPEDITESSQNEDPDIIKGHVVALLGECLGNMMVISVENDTAIGTNHDMYGNDYYCDCNGVYCDTLFAYENVIGVPLHIDCYNHQPGCLYRYVFNGDTLKTIAVNDYFEFKCQPVDMDTEYSLLFPRGICPAIYNMQEPTNMNLFKITEIKKYIKI